MTTATIDAPEPQFYAPILQRVGTVLVAVGLVDTGIKIYRLMHHSSYPTVSGVFLIVSGVFLLHGSLKIAATLRWLTIAAASGLVVLPFLAFCILQPIDLSLTKFRVYPEWYLFLAIRSVIFIWVLLWVFTEFGREPVRAAFAGAKLKQCDPRLCVIGGIALTVLIGVVFELPWISDASSKHAIRLAEKRVGPGYHFFVHSLSSFRNSDGKFIAAKVYTWNKNALWDVPVHWQPK